ncbi:MAG: NAD(P)H-hydrate epimerase [Planctomycetota bacterium]|nr:MAG: NAD(P)H-hydrate epimerase [Planctomycetota bacterium]
MRPLSELELREIDQRAIEQYGLPGVVLMENAGRGCAEVITRHWPRGKVVICCGKGNNGGDGFVIARHLDSAGWSVQVRVTESMSAIGGDAEIMRTVIERSGIDFLKANPQDDSWKGFTAALSQADLIVDALLGTGIAGAVRTPYCDWIRAINASGKPVLAVDLPSGMDCHTGLPRGVCIQATRTATMVAPKLGFENIDSHEWTGPIDVVGIGAPQVLIQQFVAVDTGTARPVPRIP